jgi:hypothetical protein
MISDLVIVDPILVATANAGPRAVAPVS